MAAAIEVFLNDDELRGLGIGFVLRSPGIVEYEDELVPGFHLTKREAVRLAAALNELAEEVE